MKIIALIFVILCSAALGFLITEASYDKIGNEIIWTVALMLNIGGLTINAYNVYRL